MSSHSTRGFTLIELMIVVVVIGILAAIGIPQFARMQDNAKEASTKTNMHTLQMSTEDYGVQNDGRYPLIMDSSHLGNLLPPNFVNPFNHSAVEGLAWENRETFAAGASPISGIVSYSDSGGALYNIKAHGKTTALTVVLTYGQ